MSFGPLFQNRAEPLQLVYQISAKKTLFGFDYNVYYAEVMHFKAISDQTSGNQFSEHTHLKHAHRKQLSHGMWALS